MKRMMRLTAAFGVVFAMVLGSPTPAKADPITAAIVTGIGLTGTAAAVATFIVNGVFSTAFSWAAGKLLGKSKGSVQERQASVTTLSLGEVPREALIGEAVTGGSLIDAFNHGGRYGTDYVTRCIALTDHVVDALVGYYIDDQYFAFTANGVQAGFSGALDIEFVNATQAGAAPPARFLTASAGSWAASDVLASITHVWFSYKCDEAVWPQGHPQVRFLLRGLKVYDPRKDAALGYSGAGPQTWADPSTHTFSRNAALLRYAFARGIYATGRQGQPEHLLIGRGLSAEEAPPESVIAAANLCDETVGGAARYTANGVIRASEDFILVEEMFAAAMAGVIVQREGGVEIEPGQAKAAVVTITDADLVAGEPVTFSEFLPDGDGGRVNTVIPRYVEPAQNWKDHSGPVRRNQTDIATDRGPREITLPLMLVTAGAQADRCAEITRRLGRLERRTTIVLPPEYGRLEEGDWIAWTSARRFAGGTVRWRIESWTLDEKWRMRLSLREIASSVFTDPTALTDGSDPPTDPGDLAALDLQGVTAQVVLLSGSGSAVPAVRFTWSAVDPGVIAIRAEVRRDGETVAAPTRTDEVSAGTMTVTNGVGPDQAIQVRLVPITRLSRPVTPSAWVSLTTGSLTAGDVVPITPGNVAGTPTISITSTIASDGTQTSRLFGTWTAPSNALTYVVELDDGTIVQQFPVTENAIEDRIVATGPTYRYRVKALSRTGTLSAAWSSWSANVTAAFVSVPEGDVAPIDANTTIIGNKIVKTSGGYTWNTGGAYTRQWYMGGASVSFRRIQGAGATGGGEVMAGLSDGNPGGTPSGYEHVDYGFYLFSPLFYVIYESASPVGSAVSYLPGDLFTVTYDGVNVRYYRESAGVVTLLRTVAAGANRSFRAHVATAGGIGTFSDGIAGVQDLRFRPFNRATRIDELWSTSGGTQYAQSEVRTAEGTAAFIAGQGALATLNLVGTNELRPGATDANLIANGGAEAGTTEGWALAEGTAFSLGVTGLAFAGRFALFISKPSTGDSSGYGSKAFRTVPGQTYVVRVSTLGSTAPATGLTIRMEERNAAPSGEYVNAANRTSFTDLYANGPVTGVWRAHEFVWTCPAGVLFASLCVWNAATGPTTLIFDEAYVFAQARERDLSARAVRLATNVVREDGTTPVTDAAAITAFGTAAFLSGQGPLATSPLTEDKVRGRYLGEQAGDAAAITAGIQNGDTYVDTSLTPYGFKVRSGGVIKEVDTSGLFKQFSTQVDINSTTMTDKVTLTLPSIQASSYMVVWMAMDIELTPSRTRKSGGTAGINPQGTWEIVEDATGGSSPKVLDSGTWEAVRVGSGGGADNIESFTVDGAVGEPTSDVSRSWRVRAGGSRTWKLRMKTNSGENLLSVGLNLLVQIQRNPA